MHTHKQTLRCCIVFISVFRVQRWSMSIKLKTYRGSFHLPFMVLAHYWSEQQYLGLEGGPPNLKQEKFRFTHCTNYQDETQPPLCLLVTVRPPMNSRWLLMPGHTANKWTCKYLESTCVSRVQQHRQHLTIQTQSFCVPKNKKKHPSTHVCMGKRDHVLSAGCCTDTS